MMQAATATARTRKTSVSHVSNPMDFVRRRIDRSKILDMEQKAHVLAWIKQIITLMGTDPRTQAMTMTAAGCYAQVVRVVSESLEQKDHKSRGITASLLTRYTTQLARSLRLAGLSKPHANGGGKGSKANPFAPAQLKAKGSERAHAMEDPVTSTPSQGVAVGGESEALITQGESEEMSVSGADSEVIGTESS